jgi:K+-sensing histidine kinase KdpD
LLTRALRALLETAVKFSAERQAVRVLHPSTDIVGVVIESFGRVIPAGALSRFFELFSIGEAITVGGDLGLGPKVASRILSLFSGSVTVENREPSGIQIRVCFR